jgi:hypothetical protein
MKPLELTHGRFRLLVSGALVRITIDGDGLSMTLSKEELLAVSKATWRAYHIAK